MIILCWMVHGWRMENDSWGQSSGLVSELTSSEWIHWVYLGNPGGPGYVHSPPGCLGWVSPLIPSLSQTVWEGRASIWIQLELLTGLGYSAAGLQLCFADLKLFPEARMMKGSFVKTGNKKHFTKPPKAKLLFPIILPLPPPTVTQSLTSNLFWERPVFHITIFLKPD